MANKNLLQYINININITIEKQLWYTYTICTHTHTYIYMHMHLYMHTAHAQYKYKTKYIEGISIFQTIDWKLSKVLKTSKQYLADNTKIFLSFIHKIYWNKLCVSKDSKDLLIYMMMSIRYMCLVRCVEDFLKKMNDQIRYIACT